MSAEPTTASSTPEGDDMLARYERGQALLQGIMTSSVARNCAVYPNWIDGTETFWYERESKNGKEFRLVKITQRTNELAFDHELVASALSRNRKSRIDPDNLPITHLQIEDDGKEMRFSAFGSAWAFNTRSAALTPLEVDDPCWVVSPDRTYAVFAKEHNLWLRKLATGEDRALTSDGEEHNVYGACGEAWGCPMPGARLQVLWSADSKRILTVQRDSRHVRELPIVEHVPIGDVRPRLRKVKVAYPGDRHVEEYRLLAIDVESGIVTEADYSRVPTIRNSWGFFDSNLGWWSDSSNLAYFVDIDRFYRRARILAFDTVTGDTRQIFEETADTHLNLVANADMRPVHMPLPHDELIWYSERTGWAHLYLYDLRSGRLKNAVTSGAWVVREIVRYDPIRRDVFVQTGGRCSGRDPHYRDLIRVNIDTGEIVPLVASDHDYFASAPNDMQLAYAQAAGRISAESANGISPDGSFAVITRSRVDQHSVSLVIDRDGCEVMQLETGEAADLPPGWHWPEPFRATAADGFTEIYGVLYRPSNFSPERRWPVVSHVFCSPELAFVPKGSFSSNSMRDFAYLDAAALAELGFVVVQVDGRGTAFRSKAFRDASYGWIESASSLEDHVAAIRQLARQYAYMDLERVGITSHFSGGPGGVQGLLKFPDFYKVGISGMSHDSRLTGAAMWGDMFEGPEASSSDRKYPEELVENLRGKLLLMHGMLDPICPPAATFRIVEALQKANKDFDLIMLPNLGHDISSYLTRRAWDFLVRHLQQEEPPVEFPLTAGVDLIIKEMMSQ